MLVAEVKQAVAPGIEPPTGPFGAGFSTPPPFGPGLGTTTTTGPWGGFPFMGPPNTLADWFRKVPSQIPGQPLSTYQSSTGPPDPLGILTWLRTLNVSILASLQNDPVLGPIVKNLLTWDQWWEGQQVRDVGVKQSGAGTGPGVQSHLPSSSEYNPFR